MNIPVTAGNPDAHFPAIHLRPAQNWINDPNGLVFHDGWFHVFVQYNPDGARHATTHWAHARSRDLLTWEALPIALAPTAGGDDADGVWSGNAVSHDGSLIAFYAAKRDDRWYQPVAAATSEDGLSFTKVGLVIEAPPAGLVMFRDPFVWKDGERWRMLVGAALDNGRAAAVHYECESPDPLGPWACTGLFAEEASQPLPGGGTTEEGWECTQFVPFGENRGVLLVSAWDPDEGAACTAAWTGTDDGRTFAPSAPERLDLGPDFYAPATMRAPDGRVLMWAWIWEARDEIRVGAPSTWTDEVGWAGMLSLPRELSPGPHSVRQAPAREIEALRGAERILRGSAEEIPIAPTCDIEVRFTENAGLSVLTSSNGEERLEIHRDPTTGEIVVDRGRASLDPRAKGGQWRLPPADDPLEDGEVRIILDHSVAELFHGGRALTIRFYPVGGGPWRLRTTGHDPESGRIFDLRPLRILEPDTDDMREASS